MIILDAQVGENFISHFFLYRWKTGWHRQFVTGNEKGKYLRWKIPMAAIVHFCRYLRDGNKHPSDPLVERI